MGSDRLRAAALGVAVLLSAGCSSSTPGAAAPAASSTVDAQVQALAGQNLDLSNAMQLVVEKCMQAAGQQYHPYLQDTSAPVNLSKIGGIMSVERAQSRGYAPDTLTTEDDAQDAIEKRLSPSQKKTYMAAYAHGQNIEVTRANGAKVKVPTQGCLPEAQRAVYGTQENYLRLDNFGFELSEAAEKSSSVDTTALQSATTSYVACMKGKGYNLVRFGDAVSQARRLPKRAPGTKPSGAELQLAMADAACQEQNHVRELANDLTLAGASEWMKSHEKEISGLAEVLSQSKARAAKIIAGGAA